MICLATVRSVSANGAARYTSRLIGLDRVLVERKDGLRTRGNFSKNKPVIDAYVTTCDKEDMRGH